MNACVITVTPEMATGWLKGSKIDNRTINKERVERYAQDMLRGAWDVTTDAIGIDDDGNVVNGHHRLFAVVKAGVPVKMFVMFGAKASTNIDTGRARSFSDSMRMAGYKDSIYQSHAVVPVARMMVTMFSRGKSGRTVSNDDLRDYIDNHYDSLSLVKRFVDKYKNRDGRVRGALSASTLGAIVFAYEHGVAAEKLEKWYGVVCTGEYESDVEKAVLLYRNFLLSDKDISTYHGRMEAMNRAETSISHFAANEAITKLYSRAIYH